MFFQDLRYAFRNLTKRPGFAVLVILTLSLGIGATTAIFSVVQAVLLRPLEYRAADRLIKIVGFDRVEGTGQSLAGRLPRFRTRQRVVPADGGERLGRPGDRFGRPRRR